jgi:hypothetical protein
MPTIDQTRRLCEPRAARTPDGAYDVSISEASLLPESVDLPAFDLDNALGGVLGRYPQRRTNE